MTATDHEQIRNLLAAYCIHVDDGDFERLASLFTEDAVVDAMGDVMQGRDTIARSMEENYIPRRRGRHVTLNSFIEVDGDSATATSDIMFVRRSKEGPLIQLMGRYTDELVRRDGAWRFRRRTIRITDDWTRPSRPRA